VVSGRENVTCDCVLSCTFGTPVERFCCSRAGLTVVLAWMCLVGFTLLRAVVYFHSIVAWTHTDHIDSRHERLRFFFRSS